MEKRGEGHGRGRRNKFGVWRILGEKGGFKRSGWRLSKRRVIAKSSGVKRKDRRIQKEEQRRSR